MKAIGMMKGCFLCVCLKIPKANGTWKLYLFNGKWTNFGRFSLLFISSNKDMLTYAIVLWMVGNSWSKSKNSTEISGKKGFIKEIARSWGIYEFSMRHIQKGDFQWMHMLEIYKKKRSFLIVAFDPGIYYMPVQMIVKAENWANHQSR